MQRTPYNPCYEFFSNKRSAQVYRKGMRAFSGTRFDCGVLTCHCIIAVLELTGYVNAKTKVSSSKLDEAAGDCKSKRCKSTRALAEKEALRARKNSVSPRSSKTDSTFAETNHLFKLRTFRGYNDDIEGSSGIGGTKGDQVDALARFASRSGCHLNKLGLIPATYRMYVREECLRVQKYKTASQWLAKPLDRRNAEGFKHFSHQSELRDGKLIKAMLSHKRGYHLGFLLVFKCDGLSPAKGSQKTDTQLQAAAPETSRVVVQKFIPERIKVRNKAWDIKAYMLIAR